MPTVKKSTPQRTKSAENISRKKENVSEKIKTETKDKIIVTAALPYANGPIHIGHLLEYIQADIYTRFLKLIDKDALYICASDMHGTPVEVNAKKAGQDPEVFANEFWTEHRRDFASYLIHFDNYYKTHSPENKELAEFFYSELKKKGYIVRKKINVIYCPHCARYLPDRYVRGTCPNCTTADQYGDICESCNITLKGTDLINPKCSLCGKTPQQKESEHYFFTLGKCTQQLLAWMDDLKNMLQPEVKNWLKEWMDKGLEDWCISRDAPYFGFEIPNAEQETGEKKYFYVWLDAPIGYISSTKNYCIQQKQHNPKYNLNWEDYWYNGKVQHFIGKDISYFHFLFWPAMLMVVGIPLPTLTVHGFITVNGQKMSKSRGTFFTAKDFLNLYPAEALRFYYASHLDRKLVDVDIDFENFKAVNNNVLVGSLGNFCYRVLTFAEKNYGKVEVIATRQDENAAIMKMMEQIRKEYEHQDFKSAVRRILEIADIGNAHFQSSEAWKDKGSNASKEAVGWCVNLARNLAVLVSPILPEFSAKIYHAFGEKNLLWDNLGFGWKGKLHKLDMLVPKIEVVPSAATFPLRMIVGEITQVRHHPNADSLYLLNVNFGLELGQKQVVAGLRKFLLPEALLHTKAVFCYNMKPTKIRGEASEAMILVADDTEKVSLLEAPKSKIGTEAMFKGVENAKSEVTFDEFKKLIMTSAGGCIWWEGKKLITPVEEVHVSGVREQARIM